MGFYDDGKENGFGQEHQNRSDSGYPPPQNGGFTPPLQNGYYPPQGGGYPPQPPQDQYGVTSMILGILSLVICFICAFFAISYANKQDAIFPNGYSKAGRICAVIAIILNIIGIVAYIILFSMGISVFEKYNYGR